MIREYQTIAEANILQALETRKRIMFSMATGLGKTVVMTNLIHHFLALGNRIMFIAHRQELISQAWNTFHRHKIVSGVVQAKVKPNYDLPCQIGSIQTMIRRPKLPPADVIFVDEAHHCMDDNSYGKILNDYYPNALVIGVTATPYRLGGKGFTKVFETLIESLQLAEGINQGFLVPLRYFACPSPDMSLAKLSAGDYRDEDSIKAMELVPIVESYLEHAKGKCGICFAINVAHSRQIVDQYMAAGVRAEHVDANTPDEIRAAIFKRLRERVTQVVVNVGIATEGVDIPNIEFVQGARPTKSLSLFFQMIGRGTRVDNEVIKDAISDEQRRFLISCSQKTHCIVLDNAGLYKEHGLPDQVVNWQRHFNGFKKQKKTIDEMIDMIEFVAEDESGREIRTKMPQEIEGLKLIEINHLEKEKIINLSAVREFDRLYALFKRLEKINKPGFKAYFEFRDYCLKNSFLMNDDVWDYLKLRLCLDEQGAEIEQRYAKKFSYIETKYEDPVRSVFRETQAKFRSNEISEFKRMTVPKGFLHKEQEKYQQNAKPA